jgi:hypothetical protein
VVAVGIENLIRERSRVNDFFDFFQNIFGAQLPAVTTRFSGKQKRPPPLYL